MTERFSNEINQGLRIKDALYEKIENITVALIKRFELYLRNVKFNTLKGVADHFIDGGWSGTNKAIFIFADGWTLELTSGNHAYLKNDKLGFLMGSGEHQGGNVYYPPTISNCQNTVAKLYELDRTLDQLLLTTYDRFVPLRSWFDDLKVRM